MRSAGGRIWPGSDPSVKQSANDPTGSVELPVAKQVCIARLIVSYISDGNMGSILNTGMGAATVSEGPEGGYSKGISEYDG